MGTDTTAADAQITEIEQSAHGLIQSLGGEANEVLAEIKVKIDEAIESLRTHIANL